MPMAAPPVPRRSGLGAKAPPIPRSKRAAPAPEPEPEPESPEELAPLPSNDGYMSELRVLFRLALPIMATSVLTYFMGIVDLSMAGHLGKEVVPEALDLPCAPRSTLHSD